jgi:hypothetical protein
VNGPVLWPFTRPRPAFAVAVTMDRTAIARGRLNGLVAGGACHGMEDRRDPLHSGFRLADGMINVRKLMRLKLDKPLLAYLGACDTAKGLIMAEEAFHLCSAMLFTGFRSVVGTMWWVDSRTSQVFAFD